MWTSKLLPLFVVALSSMALGQSVETWDAANHADSRCKVFYRYEVYGQETMQYPAGRALNELKKLQQKFPSVCYSHTGTFLIQVSVGVRARWQSQGVRTITTSTDMQIIPVDGTVMDSNGHVSNLQGTMTVPSQTVTRHVPVTITHTAQDVSLSLFGCIRDCEKKEHDAKVCDDPKVYANAAPLCDIITAPLHEKIYGHVLTKVTNGSMADAFSGMIFRHHANNDLQSMIKLMVQTVPHPLSHPALAPAL